MKITTGNNLIHRVRTSQRGQGKTSLLLFAFLLIFIAILWIGCKPGSAPKQIYEKALVSHSGTAMVVSAHPLASQAALDILKKGGNAVDAAVAAQFTLAVVYPRAGNLGGGGFMIVRDSAGEAHALDYREMAPAGASRNMYLDEKGEVDKELILKGHQAAGVPGSVHGLLTALDSLGSGISLKEIMTPAIQFAREGFRITQQEADRLNYYQEAFKKYHPLYSPFLKRKWLPGNYLTQTELSETLIRIVQRGTSGFYEGETAAYVEIEMQRGKGLITKKDLAEYKSVWREIISVPYKEYRMLSMPPPSSGGVALGQMLKMIESFSISQSGFQSGETSHLMAEIQRRAFADRAKYLGDPDYVYVPVDSLLDPDYLAYRMKDFDPDTVTSSQWVESGKFRLPVESFETTHTCVVDEQGNAVSVTTTLNSNYGCKVWIDGAGFLLNNQMDDFSAKPGVPNQFGLVGAEANAIEPGKRMLSSMTPTIIERNGDLFMLLGAPGGSTIITSIFQVFLNVAEFGMPLEKAIDAPRFHHQWLPDHIFLEEGKVDTAFKKMMSDYGYTFDHYEYIGKVKAIQRTEDGRLIGVGDPRGIDDTALGY